MFYFSASLTCFMCNVHLSCDLDLISGLIPVYGIIIIFQGKSSVEAHTLRVSYFFSGPLYIPSRKIYAMENPCSGDDKKLYGYFRAGLSVKKQTIGRIVGCYRIFWLFLIVDDFIRSRNW